MQIYLVGGAVRDELLKRPVKEKDWVVVGATPEEMLKQGYLPVGKDFPVFLHPKTKEEYALARTERKSGRGYKGFICYSAPDVTLVDDLKRRDITINAMAKTAEGKIIDPYHGLEDIKNKWLRHVSIAFAEDPLRVLRVARFAADLTDFKIHPETLVFMQSLSESGELLDLTSERIWKELEKVLRTNSPERFFEVLQECHAMSILFPEIKQLDNFRLVCRKTQEPLLRLASLLFLLTEKEREHLVKRIAIPNMYAELSNMVSNYYLTYKEILSLTANEILMLLKKTDAFRRPERFHQFIILCEMLGGHSETISQKDKRRQFLEAVLEATQSVKIPTEQMKIMSGKEIGEAIDKEKERVIKEKIEHYRESI